MGATLIIRDDDMVQLARALDDVDGLFEDIARNVAEEAINLVREGFAGQQDPYGSAWAPRKSGGGSAILVRTGSMRNSWNITELGPGGFTMAAGVDYAGYHQSGTRKMVARKMVPNEGDLPGNWEARFDDVTQEILDAHFGQ